MLRKREPHSNLASLPETGIAGTLPDRKRSPIGFNQKIVAMYARGMTERAIHDYLFSMYGADISPSQIDTVLDEVTTQAKTWQRRPLEPMYPVTFLDTFRVATCDGDTICHKSVCLAIGIRPDGTRDVLGIWIAQSECATLWQQLFGDLRVRGVNDLLVVVVDGLPGAPQTQQLLAGIHEKFPNTTVQTDIVHLIRYSLECASYSDRKAVAEALRRIYTAATDHAARRLFEEFAQQAWGVKYPEIVQAWRQTWQRIVPFLRLPLEVKRIVYGSAVIENLRARVRRAVKTRGRFVDDDAVRMTLWIALKNSATRRVRSTSEWKAAANRFAALYGNRFGDPDQGLGVGG